MHNPLGSSALSPPATIRVKLFRRHYAAPGEYAPLRGGWPHARLCASKAGRRPPYFPLLPHHHSPDFVALCASRASSFVSSLVDSHSLPDSQFCRSLLSHIFLRKISASQIHRPAYLANDELDTIKIRCTPSSLFPCCQHSQPLSRPSHTRLTKLTTIFTPARISSSTM